MHVPGWHGHLLLDILGDIDEHWAGAAGGREEEGLDDAGDVVDVEMSAHAAGARDRRI